VEGRRGEGETGRGREISGRRQLQKAVKSEK